MIKDLLSLGKYISCIEKEKRRRKIMLFSSTVFLFVFLPILFVLYFGMTKTLKNRNILLLIMSLIFYGWGEPKFIWIMMGCIGVNYIFGYLVDIYREDKIKSKWLLGSMLIINLGILGIYKYSAFTVESINGIFGLDLPIPNILLPIGISFFTFQGISYVLDVYRKRGDVLKNPLDVGLYIAFFPQLVAGPIVRYETVAAEIKSRSIREEDFSEGIARFILGLAKKVFLANQFAIIADKAYGLPTETLTVVFAWMGAIAYMLQIYFDFAGYSDMAIGLGKMFGFNFCENFNAPYMAKSISDFWRRWHVSLGSWFRDYVYIPLGGNRKGKGRQIINLLVVWLLTGIWHGANWTFIVWGLYFGVFLIIEKLASLDKAMERRKIIGHIYTLTIVLFGWILFRAPNLVGAFEYIKAMFGLQGNKVLGSLAELFLQEYFITYLLGIACCMPISNYLGRQYAECKWKNGILQGVKLVVLGILFLGSVAYLVKGVYNPFIYFNF